MDLNAIFKSRIDNTNTYELLDIDYFYFYEQFDDNYLDYIISYIEYNINELKKIEINRTELDESIKEIEEFVENLPKGLYTETPRSTGPERYNFKIHELKYNGKRNRVNWVKSVINSNIGIKVKVVDKEDEGTFDLKYLGKVSDIKKHRVEELRKTIITDEAYQKRIEEANRDKRRAVRLDKKKDRLFKKYFQNYNKYRKDSIEKATRIERWERLIWVINIEKYLRNYERENNLHIIRKPISSNDAFWNNYRINSINGIVNNVFVLKDNVPYRLIKLKEKTPMNSNYIFSKAVLEKYPDDEYEGIYHIYSNNDMNKTFNSYSYEPLNLFFLLSDTNLNDEQYDRSKDIRDFEFIKDLKDIKDEFNIEREKEEEEDDDDFKIEGTGFEDMLDWSDEIDL